MLVISNHSPDYSLNCTSLSLTTVTLKGNVTHIPVQNKVRVQHLGCTHLPCGLHLKVLIPSRGKTICVEKATHPLHLFKDSLSDRRWRT